MKAFKLALLTSFVAFAITGCTYKGSVGASNVNISNVKISEIESMKKGEACQSYFLFIPTGFDATAKTAATEAGIEKIEYQEYSNTQVFPFYGSKCITVYGK